MVDLHTPISSLWGLRDNYFSNPHSLFSFTLQIYKQFFIFVSFIMLKDVKMKKYIIIKDFLNKPHMAYS